MAGPRPRTHLFHEPVPVGEVNNHVKILRRIAREARPSACAIRPDLAPAVDEVLQRALAIECEDRFESAAEFAAAMRQALIEEHFDPNRPSGQVGGPSIGVLAASPARPFDFGSDSHDTVPAGAIPAAALLDVSTSFGTPEAVGEETKAPARRADRGDGNPAGRDRRSAPSDTGSEVQGTGDEPVARGDVPESGSEGCPLPVMGALMLLFLVVGLSLYFLR